MVAYRKDQQTKPNTGLILLYCYYLSAVRGSVIKIELLPLLSNDLLTIMLGGRLPETENKTICIISGLKGGRCPLRNLSGVRLRESSWNSI